MQTLKRAGNKPAVKYLIRISSQDRTDKRVELFSLTVIPLYMGQNTRFRALSHYLAMKAQASLRICADSPEPSLLLYTKH